MKSNELLWIRQTLALICPLARCARKIFRAAECILPDVAERAFSSKKYIILTHDTYVEIYSTVLKY